MNKKFSTLMATGLLLSGALCGNVNAAKKHVINDVAGLQTIAPDPSNASRVLGNDVAVGDTIFFAEDKKLLCICLNDSVEWRLRKLPVTI